VPGPTSAAAQTVKLATTARISASASAAVARSDGVSGAAAAESGYTYGASAAVAVARSDGASGTEAGESGYTYGA